jgi:CheY-like chemotaxis protein
MRLAGWVKAGLNQGDPGVIKRILIVDDEPMIRELVADVVREAGYRVDAAGNGAEALQVMRRHVPHAIVLDLMMPILDATGFIELKQLDQRFAAIPILVVTAAYGAHEIAKRLGAQACLTKPFEVDELVEQIDALVGGPEPVPRGRPGRSAERPIVAKA